MDPFDVKIDVIVVPVVTGVESSVVVFIVVETGVLVTMVVGTVVWVV